MVMIPRGSTPNAASGLMWGLPGGQTQLTGREGELYEELRQAESTGKTKVFTAEDAAILGIDMSGDVDDWPDWNVKFTPDNSDTGFAVSALSPDGFEYTQTGGIITPEGQSYASSQQYMQSLQTYSTTSGASGTVPGYVQLDSGEWISEFDYYSYQPEYRAKLKSAGVAGFNEYMGTTIQAKATQMNIDAGYMQIATGDWVDKAWYNTLTPQLQSILNNYGWDAFPQKVADLNAAMQWANSNGPAGWQTAGHAAAGSMLGEIQWAGPQVQNIQIGDISPLFDNLIASMSALPSYSGWKLGDIETHIQNNLLPYMSNLAINDPESFISTVNQWDREAGEDLLRVMIPTITDDEIKSIFGEIPSTGIPFSVETAPGVQAPGIINPDGTVWITTESGAKVGVGTWDTVHDVLIPLPVEPDVDTRSTWGKFCGSVASGVGGWFAQGYGIVDYIFSPAQWSQGFHAMTQYSETPLERQMGENIERAQEAMWEQETTWDEIAAQLQTQRVENGGLGWSALETVTSMLPMIAITAATGGIGASVGAGLAADLGLGTFGRVVLQGLCAWTTSEAGTVVEAMVEAGSAYEDAIGRGLSDLEAADIANDVFARNVQ